jgi:type VI secretion system protein ImpK
VREVYYLCLSLGFTGRYCNEGDEFLLEQLQTSNLKLLTGSSLGIPSLEREDLFPDAYPVGVEEAAMQKSMPRFSIFSMICFAGPVLLFAGLYMIYYFVLSSLGQNILSTVR